MSQQLTPTSNTQLLIMDHNGTHVVGKNIAVSSGQGITHKHSRLIVNTHDDVRPEGLLNSAQIKTEDSYCAGMEEQR